MIQLKKRPPIPKTLASSAVTKLKAELEERVSKGEHIASEGFPRHWSNSDVKKAVYDMHRGKCCYCERTRDERREPDTEHFRPKAKVDGIDHPGYWWLAYDWGNYFFSCKKCNEEHKKNQFPLLEESARAMGPNDDLEKEQPYLINPEKEDPERFIGFDWQRAYGVFVKAVGIDDQGRGDMTIRITGVNQGTLPEERAEQVKFLAHVTDTMKWALREGKQGAIDEAAAIIRDATDSERIFAGFRRAFFRGQGLGKYVSEE
jgi:uncharacterized protein (TIGR02646 family)